MVVLKCGGRGWSFSVVEWSGSAVFEWLPRTSTIGNSSTSPPNDAIGPSLYQSIDIRQFLPQERDNTYIATYLQ